MAILSVKAQDRYFDFFQQILISMWFKLSQNQSFWFIVAFLIILVVVCFHFTGILHPLENLVLKISSPVAAAFSTAGNKLSELVKFFNSIRTLDQENKKLKILAEKLQADLARLKEVERENNILREQLEYVKKESLPLIPALVISKDSINLLASISINKGKKDGVEKNFPVIVSSGILIGKVSEVQEDISKVLLIIDPQSSVPALVSDSQAEGIVTGEHGLGLVMDMIPQDKVIKKGDTVISSNLGKELPQGLLIGEIEEVNTSDNKLFQKARVKSPVNFKELNAVFVIAE